ncbi:MAG: hypothetical protein SGCHY_002438 [Lobulomycetales sp.]
MPQFVPILLAGVVGAVAVVVMTDEQLQKDIKAAMERASERVGRFVRKEMQKHAPQYQHFFESPSNSDCMQNDKCEVPEKKDELDFYHGLEKEPPEYDHGKSEDYAKETEKADTSLTETQLLSQGENESMALESENLEDSVYHDASPTVLSLESPIAEDTIPPTQANTLTLESQVQGKVEEKADAESRVQDNQFKNSKIVESKIQPVELLEEEVPRDIMEMEPVPTHSVLLFNSSTPQELVDISLSETASELDSQLGEESSSEKEFVIVSE